jgi:hypothetical protein
MDVQELLKRIDLQALAEEAGADFSSGDGYRSRCPLHGVDADNPTAFRIFRGSNGVWRWRCYTRCPAGQDRGTAIDFYVRWQGVDFKTALRELSKRAGMTDEAAGGNPTRSRISRPDAPRRPSPPPILPAAEPPGEQWRARAGEFVRYAQEQLWSQAGQAVLAYLREKRGYTDDTIREWGLGYNPRDEFDDPARWGLEPLRPGGKVWCPKGVVFPGLREGAAWAVSVRRPLPGDGLARAIGVVKWRPGDKFCSLHGGRRGLFGVDRLNGSPALIMAEGEPDAILAWQSISDLADVATLGGAKHRIDALDAALLTGPWVILAIYDEDEAGEEGLAYLRRASRRVVVVSPPAHDLTDYWRAGGDLRRWLAALVLEQMERLLQSLDAGQAPELFARWSEIRSRAAEAVGTGRREEKDK